MIAHILPGEAYADNPAKGKKGSTEGQKGWSTNGQEGQESRQKGGQTQENRPTNRKESSTSSSESR